MSNLTKVGVVIQGYPIELEHLRLSINQFLKAGIKKIAVSSYSKFDNCFPEYGSFHPDVIFIENDLEEGITTEDFPSSNLTEKKPTGLKLSYPGHLETETMRPNVNFQIATTLRGIYALYSKYPDMEYILKVRADMLCWNLEPSLNYMIGYLKAMEKYDKDISNLPFNQRAFLPRRSLYDKKIFCEIKNGDERNYYTAGDFVYFGTKEDIFRLFNIPFNKNDEKAEDYFMRAYPRSQGELPPWEEFTDKYLAELFDTDFKFLWFKSTVYSDEEILKIANNELN